MNGWRASRDYEQLNPSGGLENSSSGWGDDIEAQQRLHQDTIARQDEDLDEIGKGVERLGEMSLQVRGERVIVVGGGVVMKVAGYKEGWKKLLHLLHSFCFFLQALLSMLNRNVVMCVVVVVSLRDISFLSQ